MFFWWIKKYKLSPLKKEGFIKAVWLPVKKANKFLTYKSERAVVAEAIKKYNAWLKKIRGKKIEPRVSVKLVIRAGDSVMFHRTKDGIRDLPGGHIKFGETILETLKRELLEELNFKLRETPKLIYAWTYISRDKSRQEVYLVYLINIGNKLRNFIHKERNDIEFVWLKKSGIKKQKFLPEMENLLLKSFKE